MTGNKPLVSVLMSVYNTKEEWLRDCIESMLGQTLSDLEFIIITDCPTDGSDKVVLEYAAKDDRIKVIQNETNLGLTKSLNRGLAIAQGEYIARMDADDVSFRHRLEKQYHYMEEHPGIVALGAYVCTNLDMQNKEQKFPASDWTPDQEVLKIRMLFRNTGIPHPSSMLRGSVIREHNITYDERIKKSQDYKLWVDLMPYGEIQMMDEILLMYRVHDGQISAGKNNQYSYAHIVSKELAEELTGELTEEELAFHVNMTQIELPDEDVKGYERYVKKLIRLNNEKGLYDKAKFERELNYLWCRKAFRRMHFLKKYDMITKLRTLKAITPSMRAYTKEDKAVKGRRQKALARADYADCIVRNDA